MGNEDRRLKDDLKQHKNELLMYGRYNLKSLKGIIDTINALHSKQSYFEQAVKREDYNIRNFKLDVINYNFDSLMYLSNVREEHVVSYREGLIGWNSYCDTGQIA